MSLVVNETMKGVCVCALPYAQDVYAVQGHMVAYFLNQVQAAVNGSSHPELHTVCVRPSPHEGALLWRSFGSQQFNSNSGSGLTELLTDQISSNNNTTAATGRRLSRHSGDQPDITVD